MKPGVADWLAASLEQRKYATETIASQIDTEPFQFL